MNTFTIKGAAVTVAAFLLIAGCRPAGSTDPLPTIAAPTELTATVAGPGTVLLQWTPSTSEGVTEQRIASGSDPGELQPIGATLGPDANEHAVSDLQPGTWYFAISAHGAGGAASPRSNVATVTVTEGPGDPGSLIEVQARLEPGVLVADVRLHPEEGPISDVEHATLTLNGAEVPRESGSRYSLVLPDAPDPGDVLILEILVDELAPVQAEVTFLPAPHVSAPASGSVLPLDAPTVVQWTYPEGEQEPDTFGIRIAYTNPDSSPGSASRSVAGSQRQVEFEGGSVPAGATNVEIQVEALATGGFTGPAHPSSFLDTSIPSASVSVIVAAPAPTLSPPADVVVHPGRDNSVHLWWTPSGDPDATGQQILYGIDPGRLSHFAAYDASISTSVLIEVPAGNAYFAVRATGAAGAVSDLVVAPGPVTVNGLPAPEPDTGITYRISGQSLQAGAMIPYVELAGYDGDDWLGTVPHGSVMINGTAAPWDDAWTAYRLPAVLPLATGDPVTVLVSVDTVDIAADAVMPAQPTLTAPAPATVFASTALMTVEWDYPAADPHHFRIVLPYNDGPFGTELQIRVPGDQRTASFSVAVFPAGAPITGPLSVAAVDAGSFTGTAVSNRSSLNVTGPADTVVIDISWP